MQDKSKQNIKNFLENAQFAVSNAWQASKLLFIGSTLLYVIQGIFPIVIAFFAGSLINSIIDFLSGDIDATRVYAFLIASVVAQFIYNQSMYLNNYFEDKLITLITRNVTSNLQLKFVELDHSYYEDKEFNKHFNKVTQNLHAINRFSMELLRVITSIVQLLASGIALMSLNVVVSLFIILGIVPLLIVKMRTSSERWKLWESIDTDWRLRWNINWEILALRSVNEIKIFKIAAYLNDLWKRFYDRSEGARIDLEKRNQTRQLLANLAESLTQLGVNIWLLAKVLSKTGFGVGDFEFYRRIIADFSNASSRLVIGLQDATEGGLYVKDYRDLMAMKPRVRAPKQAQRIKSNPKIEFRNVSFKYPQSNEYTLRDISLEINPGEDIAIVGENGAGKTTLIKLLMRFYDVTEGEILVDGRNIKDIDLDSWYRQVGILFQDFNYYSYLKVKRSIGIGNAERINDLKGIKEAAKKAGADKFINKLEEGYDTVLDKSYDGGTDLSGGEWQRVALARAFFRNSNILILDEPTSAVDAKGEYEIFERISQTQADKTTIIISHRFSTVRNAQKICVIEDGHIKESGSHEDLIKIKDGTYKHMFELQAEGYK